MIQLKNPYLDLAYQYIETQRCIVVPFSLDSIVDIKEFAWELNKANKNSWIDTKHFNYKETIVFVKSILISMGNAEEFYNFIIDRETGKFLWAIFLTDTHSDYSSIHLWIREDEEWKWYGTEAFLAMLDWVRENTYYTYLKYRVHPDDEISGRLVLKYGGKLQPGKTPEWYLMFHITL